MSAYNPTESQGDVQTEPVPAITELLESDALLVGGGGSIVDWGTL